MLFAAADIAFTAIRCLIAISRHLILLFAATPFLAMMLTLLMPLQHAMLLPLMLLLRTIDATALMLLMPFLLRCFACFDAMLRHISMPC